MPLFCKEKLQLCSFSCLTRMTHCYFAILILKNFVYIHLVKEREVADKKD